MLSTFPVSDDGETLSIGLPAGSKFALKMLDRADVRAVVEPAAQAVFGARKLTFSEQGAASPAASRPSAAPAPSARPAAAARQPVAAQRPAASPQRPAAQGSSSQPAPAPAPAPAPRQAPASAPVPDPVPADAYGDLAAEPQPAGDFPMPWDTPAPQSAPAATTAPAPATPQPSATATPAPVAAPLSAAPAAAPVAPEDLTPEFSDILDGLTAVFGAPTAVSVEKPAAEDVPDDVPYDDEGAATADAADAGFADEPVDDADDE